MDSFPFGRVGYWWSEKKSRKFNVNEFTNVCRASGLELVKIDLDCPLEEQGPFVAIVHKLSDAIVKAEKGDVQSKAVCEAFQKYVDSHPNIVVIDPLPNVEKLLDRYRQYNLVVESELCEQGDVFIPAFVELTTKNVAENAAKLKAAGVDFPIVCKPSLAHGSTLAHQMCLIFNEEGLKDITPPCVAQKFINHNAILYKLFIIGDKYFMIERPSLKNFCAGDQKTIFFDSHDVSKPHSASALTELDDNEQLTPVIWPEIAKMDHIVHVLCNCLGLNLFGIDVIVDNKTANYAIIDMNIFPGYDEVDHFFQLLCNLILKKLSLKEAGITDASCKPTLGNCFSTSFHRVPRGIQKFSFDSISAIPDSSNKNSKAVIPYLPRCFCCPISGSCLNSLRSDMKHLKATVPSQTFCDTKNVHFIQPSKELNSHDCTQDDSGIDTSDSCDEKKREPCYRTNKRHHSRNCGCVGFTVNESD